MKYHSELSRIFMGKIVSAIVQLQKDIFNYTLF